jgi:hypothetical protein
MTFNLDSQIPNLVEIHWIFLEVEHVDEWADIIPPPTEFSFYRMHLLQRTLNNVLSLLSITDKTTKQYAEAILQ